MAIAGKDGRASGGETAPLLRTTLRVRDVGRARGRAPGADRRAVTVVAQAGLRRTTILRAKEHMKKKQGIYHTD